jgi:hypothetical protein
VRIRDQEGAGACCRLMMIPFSSGGAAGSSTSSLAAFWLGFWRGTSAEEGGGFIGAKTWTRGEELIQIRGRFGGDLPGVRRVRPGLHERDDRWAP